MKKTYMTLSAGATLALALILGSCNNAEEVKKQTEAQDTQIQALATTKLNALQDQVNTECMAKVDSMANAQFTAWQEESKKSHKGGSTKPKPKKETVAAKPAPAPATSTISNRTGTTQGNNGSTISNRQGTNNAGNSSTISKRAGATQQK